MDIVELFCKVDDFCKEFEPQMNAYQIDHGKSSRGPQSSLSLSEMMTIVIYFHQSDYRTFKHFYLIRVCENLNHYFPDLVSYSYFVSLMSQLIFPLHCYLHTRLGDVTGIAFIDSTPIVVCHNRRIHSHKVFKGIAKRGKSSTGWFFGFKVHIIINDKGELLAFQFSPGNTDDRIPVPNMTQNLFGRLFGDKGYISKKLFTDLYERGLQLITKLKKNMKNQLMPIADKVLLRKRSLIETVNDQLKNISQIEHSRHRSPFNFFVNLYSALIAYSHQEKKPSLNLTKNDLKALAIKT
ncbi:IS982 family transposase [Simkania negevensis]|uniref:IS982 family transposase n=1 Tax=Simkania negevensis TaxID=83561 RepID=A0ABS3AQQ2_9BACT|nr:IS982 family transposase [Simkania negevensis]